MAAHSEMRVISLIKVKGELDSNTFKDRLLKVAKKFNIKKLEIIETLGRVDYAIIYRAKSIEDVSHLATEIRKISDVIDSETLVGITLK